MYGDSTVSRADYPQMTAEPTFDVDDLTQQIQERLMTAEKLINVLREENKALRQRIFGIYETAKRL